MPRRNTSVKEKTKLIPAVDLHFHGAFGVDVMRAGPAELDGLSLKLAARLVHGFCPTTLSAPLATLADTLPRLGRWTRKAQTDLPPKHAIPLGLHLEGPFINPAAAGAHPKGVLRRATLAELEELWRQSHHTLKIITLAPELLSATELRAIVRWATKRDVILSLGHSIATSEEARAAFRAGIQNVTHLWNAMPFHHRAPGVVGAAIGRKDTFIEIIPDGVHTSPEVVRLTQRAHPANRLCFVSDAAPAACLKHGAWSDFGSLRIRQVGGACRTKEGHLAGGGSLLSEIAGVWQSALAEVDRPAAALTATHAWDAPVEALKLSRTLRSELARRRGKR